MAGIAKAEKLNKAPDYDVIDSTIATNLTAPCISRPLCSRS